MDVIPAIDLRGGRCVRLVQGDYDKEVSFSDDPVSMARTWVDAGARRLHVVDLDGAREGRPVNDAVVRSIIDAVDAAVEVAGGIRDLDAIERWLEAGAERVVLGTAAVRDPAFAAEATRRQGERVMVSIDAKDGIVATDGWETASGERVEDAFGRFVTLGVKRFVYTDIGRDGTLTSPNFEAVESIVRATPAPVIAAGGVAEVAHIVRLAEIGVEGVIVGLALYDGRVDLREALAAVGG